jgi:signal transduction histidine kinase/tetratricopeptide (TPR) repeat protein
MYKVKILLQRQSQLISFFLLTIVIPSVVLGIFAIRAIRNERYRQEQQIHDKQQRAVLLLREQFSDQLKNMEEFLWEAVRLPAFRDREYRAIRRYFHSSLFDSLPVDQVFILFKEGSTFYPQLQPSPDKLEYSDPILTAEQKKIMTLAWEAEFARFDYDSAILLYQELAGKAENENTKAQMLNHLARAQKKSGNCISAIHTYKRIIEQYPSSMSSARLPLALTAGMQVADCDRLSGNRSRALDGALTLYDRILEGEWSLTENQFLMYAEMAGEVVEELLDDRPAGGGHEEKRRQYSVFQEKHKRRIGHWKVRRKIEAEIITALKEMASRPAPGSLHLSRIIRDEDFLITVVPASCLLCVKWDNDRLIREWIKPIVDNLLLNTGSKIYIMDSSGKILMGDKDHERASASFMGGFDDSFPPWKVGMVQTRSDNRIGIVLYKSYYFWSILTLLTILIFGTWLIIRTLGREHEIMAIKSEFVSSVSHELKTPLTSIRALNERLLNGKVKGAGKMHQYFSMIDRDANKLIRLVKNILDFSKIEAGKKEYFFVITDVAAWLDEAVDDFCKDHIHDRIVIRRHVDADIPAIVMDREALSQCLNNLLDNALKFSPKPKPIDVFLKKESGSIVIRVKDHGIGIPMEDLDRIFEKFFQGTPSIQQPVKGTGLGLALVKHAILAHGGRITVQSRPGQGSTFTLYLPISNPHS